jgi:hypothetical protein
MCEDGRVKFAACLFALAPVAVCTSISAAQDFGGQQTITASADGACSVYATDLDGDGDADVLSASALDNKIAWYENQGGGVFSDQQTNASSISQ